MCWKSRTKPSKMVADKDIRVFKIGRVLPYCNEGGEIVIPYFFRTPLYYEEAVEYNEKMNPCEPLLNFDEYIINKGFHSYSLNNIRLKDDSTYKYPGITIYTERTTAISNDVIYNAPQYGTKHAAILLCIIPKGSTYYINSVGEIVSDKLRVEKILKRPFDINKNGSTSKRSVERVNKVLDEWIN